MGFSPLTNALQPGYFHLILGTNVPKVRAGLSGTLHARESNVCCQAPNKSELPTRGASFLCPPTIQGLQGTEDLKPGTPGRCLKLDEDKSWPLHVI